MKVEVLLRLGCLLLPLWASCSWAVTSVNPIEDIAKTKVWRNLLHYQKRFFLGPERSQADGARFFLHPDGSKDPALELAATVAALARPASDFAVNMHPQCLFPARLAFIRKSFSARHVPFDVPKIDCPDYQAWKSQLSANALSVVFATAYSNNPASMFGHTFLRIHRAGVPSDLLDYSVNFAADADPSKFGAFGMAYVFSGLTGGYHGFFNIAPYYMKVNEYSATDNRDLWEYELNFTLDEVDHVVSHIWELYATTYFDYYFLDENCSSLLLLMLASVREDLDFPSLQDVMVVPGETIRDLTQHLGLVRDVRFRPSLRKKFLAQIDVLQPDEIKLLEHLKDEKKDPSVITNRRALLAYSEYLNFKKFKEGEVNFTDIDRSRLRNTLVRISRVPGDQVIELQASQIEKPLPPHTSHFPTSVAVGSFFRSHGVASRALSMRAQGGFHDFLADPAGYQKESSIRFMDVHLHYLLDEKRIRAESITVFEIKSLFPNHPFDSEASWMLRVGFDRIRDTSCGDCFGLSLDAAPGISKEFGYGMAYVFAGLGFDWAQGLSNSVRLGPEISTGLVQGLTKKIRIHPEAKINYDGLISGYVDPWRYQMGLGASYTLVKNHEIRTTIKRDPFAWQAALEWVIW